MGVTFNQNGYREEIEAIPETVLFSGTLTPGRFPKEPRAPGNQRLSHDATQGEFTLTFEDKSTSPLAMMQR